MNRHQLIKREKLLLGFSAIVGICLSMTSCKEEIDTSDLYTFTGETVSSFLAENTDCTQYYELLQIIPQSTKSKSSVASLLSARGNYTCFAPSNDAIKTYLETMQTSKKITTANFQEFVDSLKTGSFVYDSIAKSIVYNSVIDCGTESAYETATFPEGRFDLPNMNDRYLTASSSSETGSKLVYSVSGTNQIINADNEVENGYVHVLNGVIAPTDASVYELLMGKDEMKIFSALLKMTGWSEELGAVQDDEYEDVYPLLDPSPQFSSEGSVLHVIPEHRKYGFTAFVETDPVYKEVLGTDVNANNIAEKLSAYLKNNKSFNENVFSDLDWNTDEESLKKANNIINQFVAYHLLPINLDPNKIVIHFNEIGFDLSNYWNNNIIQPSIPVFEYYETMSKDGRRRLMKITQSKQTGDVKKINRKTEMIANTTTYEEGAVLIPGIGIEVNMANINETEAMNGIVYPIDDLLVYDDDVITSVLNERLRFDIASLMPELINLNYRRQKGNYNIGGQSKPYLYFPIGFDFVNMTREQGTNVYYLPGSNNPGWGDYQGDEFIVSGTYDFTFKLPPVPSDGEYEIRYGIQGNNQRGMAQVYFGTQGNIQPAGIPLDLRLDDANGKMQKYGWEEESEDESYNLEVAKALRNKDHMRGPRYFLGNGYSDPKSAYTYDTMGRRILVRQTLKANETYYLRFKSVLESDKTEFFFDYIEICPKNVYANPTEPEDEW